MKRLLWLFAPLLLLAFAGVKPAQEVKSEPKAEPKEAKVEAEPEKAAVGSKAPEFTLKNADGKEVKLSDYEGRIVVIEWINLDCPACRKHYAGEALVAQQKKLREDGGEWLLICSSGKGKQGNFDAETLKMRLKNVNLEGAHYLIDEDGAVGRKYQAKTTPHVFVIDKKGVLRYAGALDNQKRGGDAVNYVEKAIEAINGDKEVAEKETRSYG